MLESQISITYVDAWSRWLNGEVVSNYLLWNVQILWLGRIGKLVSFLSALTIIAEIIGPTRIRDFGASLHGRFTLQMVLNNIKKSLAALQLARQYFSAKDDEQDRILEQFFLKTRVGWMTIILVYAGGGFTFYELYFKRSFWAALGYSLLILVVGTYLAPFISVLILTLPVVILLFIDSLVVEPVAWVLERESIDKLIKFLSLALLIIGFHFDLLAS